MRREKSMKAKQYFEKYGELIMDNHKNGSIHYIKKLLADMSVEARTLCEKRNAQCDSAAVATFKEMNQRWNTLCSMFEKRYGSSPIKRNGFMEYWKKAMPELTRMV
jgi:hypothetical protein